MEASFVVPGPLDVAGTLSRFHPGVKTRSTASPTVCFDGASGAGDGAAHGGPDSQRLWRSISTPWPAFPTTR
jgi:hypothetical protein